MRLSQRTVFRLIFALPVGLALVFFVLELRGVDVPDWCWSMPIAWFFGGLMVWAGLRVGTGVHDEVLPGQVRS